MRLATRLDSLIALRSMRADRQPDLFGALSVLERAGADGVVCRLDGSGAPGDKELALLRKQSPLHFCLAVSPVAADVQRAIDLRPDMVLFQTASASGGRMDLASAGEALRELVIQLHAHGIVVQMEVDPELQQIRECKRLEADFLLLDTTRFAEQSDERESLAEEGRLLEATMAARKFGLRVAMGGGISYQTVSRLAAIQGAEELVVGHALFARAMLDGLDRAVRDLRERIHFR